MKKIKYKKSLIITTATILFTISFIILSLGFSASSSNLAVDGSLLVRSDEDVRITNVQLNTKFLQAASQIKIPSYTVHSVAGGVRLTSASSQVVYDVTVTNLSSQDVLVTSVNELEWSNINMQYELENLVINETKIPAASSYTFQIKVTFRPNIISKILGLAETIIENVLGISLNLNMALDFTFYKIPQYTFKSPCTSMIPRIIIHRKINYFSFVFSHKNSNMIHKEYYTSYTKLGFSPSFNNHE